MLVDKPYYNEAGYEKQVGSQEGERNTVLYNEQAFLASAKTMMYLMRRPPKHTERLVRSHFVRRGDAVLAACEAYLQGCPVGAYVSPEEENNKSENTNQNQSENTAGGSTPWRSADACPPSGGFKLILSKLVPKLRAAFQENKALARANAVP